MVHSLTLVMAMMMIALHWTSNYIDPYVLARATNCSKCCWCWWQCQCRVPNAFDRLSPAPSSFLSFFFSFSRKFAPTTITTNTREVGGGLFVIESSHFTTTSTIISIAISSTLLLMAMLNNNAIVEGHWLEPPSGIAMPPKLAAPFLLRRQPATPTKTKQLDCRFCCTLSSW